MDNQVELEPRMTSAITGIRSQRPLNPVPDRAPGTRARRGRIAFSPARIATAPSRDEAQGDDKR
jgi:hypothetical protein